MSLLPKKQKGFTIIELMIATTIFSLVLMIALGGVLQITKMYYRAITQNRTREVARTVIDEIAEAVRFSNQSIQIGPVVSGPQVAAADNSVGYFCIGQKRYAYAIDRQVKKSPTAAKHKKHALWVDQLSGCSAPSATFLDSDVPSSDGRDLVPENMRLFNLRIVERDPTSQIFDIYLGLAYGDDDLLSPRPVTTPTELTCEGNFVGVEFCATTNFLVTVQKRL